MTTTSDTIRTTNPRYYRKSDHRHASVYEIEHLFDDWLDKKYSRVQIDGVCYRASQVLARVDCTKYNRLLRQWLDANAWEWVKNGSDR